LHYPNQPILTPLLKVLLKVSTGENPAGNAIDFHVQVLGLSFHDAMRQITGT
jgi:hypothetical protein